MIKEFLEFLYFDYNMLPKNNNKSGIIKKLEQYNNGTYGMYLKFLKSKFYILNDLLNILIYDPYVSMENKIFLKKILKESKERERQKNHLNI